MGHTLTCYIRSASLLSLNECAGGGEGGCAAYMPSKCSYYSVAHSPVMSTYSGVGGNV